MFSPLLHWNKINSSFRIAAQIIAKEHGYKGKLSLFLNCACNTFNDARKKMNSSTLQRKTKEELDSWLPHAEVQRYLDESMIGSKRNRDSTDSCSSNSDREKVHVKINATRKQGSRHPNKVSTNISRLIACSSNLEAIPELNIPIDEPEIIRPPPNKKPKMPNTFEVVVIEKNKRKVLGLVEELEDPPIELPNEHKFVFVRKVLADYKNLVILKYDPIKEKYQSGKFSKVEVLLSGIVIPNKFLEVYKEKV